MSYLPYAGIGSRETPKHILTIMHHIGAYLCSEGWTLRSGGANGADSAFEQGVDDQEGKILLPKKEIYLPWAGFNHSRSKLHPDNIPFTTEETVLTFKYHPYWNKCSPAARKMHIRNTRQILGTEFVNGPVVTPVKFVVCWTPNGAITGGTGQALRIANALNIPICNLGSAKNEKELEAQVLALDELQKKAKEETVNEPVS